MKKKILTVCLFLLAVFNVFSQEDFKTDFEIALKKAEAGDAEAQYFVGLSYLSGTGTQQNDKEAFYWLEKSAEQNFAEAQYNLGIMYGNGIGTLKDVKQAIYWYEKAANQDSSEAQILLAGIYRKLRDYKKTFYWIKKAAINGNSNGQYLLAGMYYFGDGILKDKQKAFYWYKKSAEQDNADAQYKLAYMYYLGNEVSKDYKKAFYWVEKSAKQNNPDAQCLLGGMYYFGTGISINKRQSAYWIKKAHENNHPNAEKYWIEWELWKYDDAAKNIPVSKNYEEWLTFGFQYGNYWEKLEKQEGKATGYLGSPGFVLNGYIFFNKKNIGLFISDSFLFPNKSVTTINGITIKDGVKDFSFKFLFEFVLGPGFKYSIIDKLDLHLGAGLNITMLSAKLNKTIIDPITFQTFYLKKNIFSLLLGLAGDMGFKYNMTEMIYIDVGTKIAIDFANYSKITTNILGQSIAKWTSGYFGFHLNPYIGIGVILH